MLRFPLPPRTSIQSVTLRPLERLDVLYALAGDASTAPLPLDGDFPALRALASDIVLDPGDRLRALQLRHDLVRVSIVAVNDIPVAAPYLPAHEFLAWTLRTTRFLEAAFVRVHQHWWPDDERRRQPR